MSGFVEGIDRSQSTFFPAMLDDYVAEDIADVVAASDLHFASDRRPSSERCLALDNMKPVSAKTTSMKVSCRT